MYIRLAYQSVGVIYGDIGTRCEMPKNNKL